MTSLAWSSSYNYCAPKQSMLPIEIFFSLSTVQKFVFNCFDFVKGGFIGWMKPFVVIKCYTFLFKLFYSVFSCIFKSWVSTVLTFFDFYPLKHGRQNLDIHVQSHVLCLLSVDFQKALLKYKSQFINYSVFYISSLVVRYLHWWNSSGLFCLRIMVW